MASEKENGSAAGAAPIASKHTPGPWRVHPYEINVGPYNKGRDVGPAGRSVAQVIGEFENPTPGGEAEANARLIAAAPDLLEALRDLLDTSQPNQAHYNEEADDIARHRARAAIKRATEG